MNLEEPIMPADYVDSVLSAVEEVLDQWTKEHAPQEIYDLVVDYMMMMRYLASAWEGCTTNWDNQNILDHLPSAVRILDKMNFHFHDLTGGEMVPHREWLVENGFRKPEEVLLQQRKCRRVDGPKPAHSSQVRRKAGKAKPARVAAQAT